MMHFVASDCLYSPFLKFGSSHITTTVEWLRSQDHPDVVDTKQLQKMKNDVVKEK
jgi:hypothetical protein